jgi:hypothetical protein
LSLCHGMSPAVLSCVTIDTRAAGPVSTPNYGASSNLSTFVRAHALQRQGRYVAARRATIEPPAPRQTDCLVPRAGLCQTWSWSRRPALMLRTALRVMSPTSENTPFCCSSPLAPRWQPTLRLGLRLRLLLGCRLKQLNPRPVLATADGHASAR